MIPTTSELHELLNDDDPLRLVIRGHQAIEAALDACISEVLPDPHALEIERLSFSFKIDLATALRILEPDSRPSIHMLNRIRNAFAHKRHPGFSKATALELANTLSERQRSALGYALAQPPDQFTDPIDLVARVVALVFIELSTRVAHLREKKLADEALAEMVHEAVSKVSRRPGRELYTRKVDAELHARVEKKRKARNTRGGPDGGTA
jgi:hypothetical protein